MVFPNEGNIEDTEHWRIISQPVRELGYERMEWDFSRTLAVPPVGLIAVMAQEVAKVLDGTCFGVCGFKDHTQKPSKPGPKSPISQDQNIYGALSLYRASFVFRRGLVAQDDYAHVWAYGTDPRDTRLIGFVNTKSQMTEPKRSPIWAVVDKINKIRIKL
jgi:hypothetical protein